MRLLSRCLLCAVSIGPIASLAVVGQTAPANTSIRMSLYSVEVVPGDPPRLAIARDGEAVFEVPMVSGLASDTHQEQLSAIQYSVIAANQGYELDATAQSNLWAGRRFQWRFFADRIEFQQFASGHGKLGRAYFLSNGVSNRWDNGTTPGHAWDTAIYADRYFSPNPNHANGFHPHP